MQPNADLKWVPGSGVDGDGHNLSWWKGKAKRWAVQFEHSMDRPTLTIMVPHYDRAGKHVGRQEFTPDDLKGAKAFAKSWLEETSGSASVEARVEFPHESRKNVSFDIGEYRNSGSDGFYVWSVNKSGAAITRSGRQQGSDEAIADARGRAQKDQLYDYVVTFGSDPTAGDFEIVKAFQAWSGQVYFTTELDKRFGEALRGYRENPPRKFAVDYVLGSGEYTMVIEGEHRHQVFDVLRKQLAKERKPWTMLRVRAATQADINAAKGRA